MTAVHPSVREAFGPITDELEGVKDFCYLCRAGKVTTANGCALLTVEQALPLDWRKPDGSRATREEIAAEWHLINEHQELAGKVAEQCLKLPRPHGGGPLRLTPASREALSKGRLDATIADLSRRYPGWETWPPQSCLALLLSVWATGTASEYPKRDAALALRDFAGAAAESAIRGNVPRSAVVEALFLEAAKAAPLDAPEEPPAISDADRARTTALVASTLDASIAAGIERDRRERDA